MILTIIGAGPGGYETAAAAAANGIETYLISEGPLGGTCLNEGCIPTKALCRNAELIEDVRKAEKFGVSFACQPDGAPAFVFDIHKAMERKNEVVDQLRGGIGMILKNKLIHIVQGKASFKDAHTVEVKSAEGEVTEIVSDYIMIATGSVSASLPIPGADLKGVITSKEMLEMDHVPGRLCIIGAGVIGLEFASIFNSFGSQVTVLEYCKDVLPHFDTDLAKRLKQALGKRGINIETAAQVLSVEECPDEGLKVSYKKKDVVEEVVADTVLMAVGRRPNLASLNLADIGIDFTPKGIVTDADMRTNVPHIFAVGDIRGGLMLAHVATFEGRVALNAILAENNLLQEPEKIDFGIVPAAVFTVPEVATVGLTEEQCKEKGYAIKCYKSMFRANGKALAMDETEGYCKIIAYTGEDGTYPKGTILGAHILGAHASDLVQEVAAVMSLHGTVNDLKCTVHSHPSLSEVVLSAVR